MIRLPLPRSLRGRIVLLILLALLVAQAVSLVVFVDERGLAVRTALGLEAAGRAANVARLIEEAPESLHPSILRAADSPLVRFTLDPAPRVEHAGSDAGRGMAMRIRGLLGGPADRDVRVETHVMRVTAQMPPNMPPAMAPMHRAMMEQRTEPVELLVSIALTGGDWLNVRTMFHRPPLQWAWSSGLTFALSAVLIVAVVWFALRRITGPLTELAGAADRLGRGEAVAEIPSTGPAELVRLTDAFNLMQARLSRFVSERTRLLAALGHDLRSPLTAMRIRLELLDEGEDRERLTAMVDEMQAMVESTLTFARGEAAGEASQTIDMGDLAESIAREITEAGGRAETTADPAALVRARPTAIRRALRNIVENAVRYGGSAEIRVDRSTGTVEIAVSDHGPGIPEADQAAVFEPFVRLENSRSRETGGIGLGLAIARTIIHAHGGEIGLENRPEGGLRATIRLPAA